MCTFIGYTPNHKGYLCLDMKTHKIIMLRNVVFVENEFPFLHNRKTEITTNLQSNFVRIPSWLVSFPMPLNVVKGSPTHVSQLANLGTDILILLLSL